MPTRGRPRFVAQAIAYFRRQDYPNRELVIVYDDATDLPELTGGPDIKLVRTPAASAPNARPASKPRGATSSPIGTMTTGTRPSD